MAFILTAAGLLAVNSAAALPPVNPPNPDIPPIHAEAAKISPDFTVQADFALYSAYVSRGQIDSDRPVIEPALTERGPPKEAKNGGTRSVASVGVLQEAQTL